MITLPLRWFGPATIWMSACAFTEATGAGLVPGRDATLAGHYYLKGVREVGAELSLHADGTFLYSLAYGGVNQSANGIWSVDGTSLKLQSETLPPPSFVWGSARADLDPSSGDSGDPPLVLLVKVVTPSTGITWSDILVTAEFSNGKSRTGTTAQSGFIGFVYRRDRDWRGAAVRRITLTYQKAGISSATFPIDAKTTKTVTVNFEPGTMMPNAFDLLELRVRTDKPGATTLIEKSPPAGKGWTYTQAP